VDAAHALSRAWQQFDIGLVLLALAVVQTFSGKAAAISKFNGITWYVRKDSPRGFWITVSVWISLGLLAVALGSPVILGFRAWG
jgi:hypothetical protein